MPKRYILDLNNFKGNKKELDKLLSVIGSDDSREYIAGSNVWSISTEKAEEVQPLLPASIKLEEDTVGTQLKFGLYKYQRKAVRFGLEKGYGIIVAPCGAGKTPALISLFLDCKSHDIIPQDAQGLVLVKASLKIQWSKEIQRFSELKAKLLKTSKDIKAAYNKKITKLEKELKSALCGGREFYDTVERLENEITKLKAEADELFLQQFADCDLMIANYETLRDPEVLAALINNKKLAWIGADEIHYIKNDAAARSKALFKLSHVTARFGTTATPLQKGVADAYSISKFIAPGTFTNKDRFLARYAKLNNFGQVIGSKNEEELNSILKDYMLVIDKEEVSSQLPKMVVVQRYCNLTPKQEKMTAKLLEEIREYKEEEEAIYAKFGGKPPMDNPELIKVQGNIMARQTFAAELADSEILLKESETALAKKYCTGEKGNSPKIEMLLDLLEEIFASGEKATIYSRFKKLQAVLTDAINERFPDVKIAYVNGDLSAEQRHKEVYEKFNEQDDYKILLLSESGAEGLNLSKCKYLLEMEPAQSYAMSTQIRGRVQRSDSVHSQIFIIQLLAENSYDEIGLKIVSNKNTLDNKVIRGKKE